jgi:hypothetical protein
MAANVYVRLLAYHRPGAADTPLFVKIQHHSLSRAENVGFLATDP